MSTIRRDLRKRFIEIMKEEIQYIFSMEEVAEKLADAAIEICGEAVRPMPKLDLSKTDPAWAILAGEQVDSSGNILAQEAKDAFEVGMHFNPLPWSSTRAWEKLEKFVIQEYQKDKLIFTKYKTWQNSDGKYIALSNRKIKASPEDFIACWPDFLAHSAMYSKPQQMRLVETDDKGTPISY